MPWTATDATRHTKKADTAKKKRQWAEVANSALERCLEDGGDRDECETRAVKQANAVVAREGEPMSDANVAEAVQKSVDGKKHPASHFLVVGDPEKVTTWHLRYKNPDGSVSHRLMGAAKAALTDPSGFRGQRYQGPDKEKALRKLKALYKGEGLEWEEGAAPEDAAFVEQYYAEEPAILPIPVPWAALSFEDVKQAKAAEDYRRGVDFLTDVFRQVFANIMCRDYDGDGQPLDMAQRIGMVRGLVDEFAAELRDLEDGFAEAEVAENAAGFPQRTVYEEPLREANVGHVVRLIERADADGDRRGPLQMDVAIIRPGWGNTRDNHYYPREVLERDIGAFRGAKMYATDHRQEDKSVLTEVSQVLDVPVAWTADGQPVARVGVFGGDFAESVRGRAELGTLEDLHCSILAKGRVRDGFEQGGRKGAYVEAITEGLSVDWVTRAGAGGHAVSVVAESAEEESVVSEEEKKQEELQGDDGQPVEEGAEAVLAEGDGENDADDQTQDAQEPETAEQAQESADPPEPSYLSEAEVREVLEGQKLPEPLRKYLQAERHESTESLQERTKALREAFSQAVGAGRVTGLGESQGPEATMSEQEYEQRMATIWERHGLRPRFLKESE